jgi:hypothetical protein
MYTKPKYEPTLSKTAKPSFMFFLFKFDCMCPCLDVEKQKHQSGRFHRFFLVILQMEILDICLACLIDFF